MTCACLFLFLFLKVRADGAASRPCPDQGAGCRCARRSRRPGRQPRSRGDVQVFQAVPVRATTAQAASASGCPASPPPARPRPRAGQRPVRRRSRPADAPRRRAVRRIASAPPAAQARRRTARPAATISPRPRASPGDVALDQPRHRIPLRLRLAPAGALLGPFLLSVEIASHSVLATECRSGTACAFSDFPHLPLKLSWHLSCKAPSAAPAVFQNGMKRSQARSQTATPPYFFPSGVPEKSASVA